MLKLSLFRAAIAAVILLCMFTSEGAAHNGSVVVSSVVTNITVDGKFDDWPDGTPWHPIGLNLYGDPATDESDCVAEFRIGIDPDELQVYVVVRVRDESLIAPTPGFRNWKSNDASTVYLGVPKLSEDDSFSGNQRFSPHKVIDKYDTSTKQFTSEMRFDLHDAPTPELKLPFAAAFTVGYMDKDEDDSFSVYFWSPEISKSVSPQRRGDLIVCGSDRGKLLGRVRNAAISNQVGSILLDFEAIDNPLLRFRLRTKAEGAYNIDLPPGVYRRTGTHVAPSNVRVKAGVTTVDLIDFRNRARERLLLKNYELSPRVTPGYDPMISKAPEANYFEMTKLNGLPDSRICAISQDSRGALWIATESNLARFDGTRLRVYDEKLVTDVQGIWADEARERLWIAGRDQVGFLSEDTVTRFPLLRNRRATCIGPTHDQRMLIGTNCGLFIFDGQQFAYHSKNDGLPDVRITSIAKDSKRAVTWVGTNQGLVSFDGSNYRVLDHQDGLADPRIVSLFADSRGILWVGTASSLYRYDGSFQLVRKHETERVRYARSFCEMPNGMISVGTYEGSLRIPTEYPNKKYSLWPESVPCDALFLDRDDQLWQGFQDGELRRRDLGLQKVYSSKEGRCKHLWSIGKYLWFLQDHSGGKPGTVAPNDRWQVIQFDKTKRHRHDTFNFPGNEDWSAEVTMFIATEQNGIWIGTAERGLFRLVGREFERVELPTESFATVSSMFEDSRGRLWIATLRDLFVVEKGKITVRKIPNRPRSADLLHVTESETDGAIAAGTEEGIYVFDDEKLIAHYHESAELLANVPSAILYDDAGTLWATTQRGLQGLGKNGSRVFNSDNRLLDDHPTWIHHWNGEIWCGSDAGVNRISQETGLVQYLLGKDGLGGNKILSAVSEGQTIWLAGDSGVWRYRQGRHAPTVAFDDIVTNESIGARDKISVTTDQKTILFKFHSISLKDRQHGVVYEFRLAGRDQAWTPTNSTEARINVPKQGTYQFEVRATDRDLLTSEVKRVELVVSPPYGRLATQLGLIAVSCACAILGVLYYARTRHEKRELERRVEERTTQLSKMERRLQHAQKMESLGTLASGVAHDFNNSLLAINGNAELALLCDTIAEKDELVSEVLAVTEQAAGLTRSMLMFGGKTSSKKTVIDIRSAVREAEKILRRTLPASIKFNCSVSDSPIFCEADASQLQQVTLNLALNARDAMPAGGTLIISVSQSSGSARLHVRDNGHGMSPETKKRIFEPFYTEKARGKGTGLGLAVVHAIVEDHSGEISVDSTQNEGTEFTVTIPNKASLEIEQPRSPTALIKSRGKILIADDETAVLKMLAQALRRAGFKVDTCGDGRECVQRCTKDDYDMVVLDIDMPGQNGWDSLGEIRKRNQQVAAIMISGLPNQSTRIHQRTKFIRKPFSLHEFTREVSTLMKNVR